MEMHCVQWLGHQVGLWEHFGYSEIILEVIAPNGFCVAICCALWVWKEPYEEIIQPTFPQKCGFSSSRTFSTTNINFQLKLNIYIEYSWIFKFGNLSYFFSPLVFNLDNQNIAAKRFPHCWVLGFFFFFFDTSVSNCLQRMRRKACSKEDNSFLLLIVVKSIARNRKLTNSSQCICGAGRLLAARKMPREAVESFLEVFKDRVDVVLGDMVYCAILVVGGWFGWMASEVFSNLNGSMSPTFPGDFSWLWDMDFLAASFINSK